MFKLWLFGCSFSAQYSDQGYYKMLADKLNAELCINAYSGAGLGYLMYQSMKHRHEFAEDDYIIFQTTSSNVCKFRVAFAETSTIHRPFFSL